jgi:hypothetical protein
MAAGLVCLIAAGTARAQTADFLATDATMGLIVRGQPFSADGLTTITQVLADGTRIEQSAPSRFFRDSEGRVRREQTILGLAALARPGQTQHVVTLADPVAHVTWSLYPERAAARRAPPSQREPRGPISFGSRPGRTITFTTAAEPGTAGLWESLGTREVEGVAASGARTSRTIPTGSIGNDRPIEITTERWMAEELQVLLLSREHDPRTGTVEFRLTNIQRTEPPRELFTVPPDYRIIDAPPPLPLPSPPAKPIDPAGPPPPPPAPPAPAVVKPAPAPQGSEAAVKPRPPAPPAPPPARPIDRAGPPPPPPAPPQ